jgi:hypothetical protein
MSDERTARDIDAGLARWVLEKTASQPLARAAESASAAYAAFTFSSS